MRRRVRRAPLLALSTLVLVVVLGAACSDDGRDDDTSPTTTSPATTEASDEPSGDGDGATTTGPAEDATTSEPAGTTEPGAVPGDDADVLTSEQAQAQLDALLAAYRQGLVDTRAAGVADERTLQAFSGAFTSSYANAQVQALQETGVEKINPTPPEVAVSDVEVTSATATCAGGSVTVGGLDQLVDYGAEIVPPLYFRLEPAAQGAAAPAWRIALLNVSADGEPLEEASCE